MATRIKVTVALPNGPSWTLSRLEPGWGSRSIEYRMAVHEQMISEALGCLVISVDAEDPADD